MDIIGKLRIIRPKLIPNPIWRKIKSLKNYKLVPGPLTYNQDGLATRHNADFIQNERFRRAYALGKATGSWGKVDVHWRAHVACWAAQKGLSVEGDFVECGVNRGGLARTVLDYVDLCSTSRKFFLLDTFEGLVDRYISEDERKLGIRQGGYEDCFEDVKRRFEPFQNVVLIRGAVPETLSAVTSDHIAYLSIDMNCVAPEIAAAEYFWPKLSSGAVIVLDDYGWSKHIMQKQAFDSFAEAHGVQVLSLPTGQGIMIKP
ncbi:MAG: TylF/MycF/NovP-related O-methyltransferase [Desulfosalsimonadaceae bacterium]|nr:TylF/MycF/NovP-related O-methyltransferase [Desulfosalsimonadaceae bacterium]